jgi:acetyl esterase
MTHPIDDEARDFLNVVEANPPPPAREVPIEEFRRLAYDALKVSGHPEPLEEIGDEEVDGAAGPLRARRYMPAEAGDGLLVYFHGGGFVRGDLNTHDPLCRRLANSSRCRLLAIDYRLAPEHPFPAAAEDAVAATEWAAAQHAGPLAVGGDSSGGNIAAVAAIHARDAGGPELAAQVLLYPVTDATMGSPSMEELAAGRMLTKDALSWMYDQYLPDGADRSDPRASPVLAESLEGVAPAVVVTAGNDPLRDDANRYATRLEEAGVPVEHLVYGGTIHSFMLYAGALQAGMEGSRAVGQALARLLQTARNSA